MLCRTSSFVLAATLLSSLVSSANATVIQPISATATSFYAPDDRAAIHAVDNSGMTAGVPWESAGTTPGGAMWLNNSNAADPTPTITFDLGADHSLTGFHLWNYNEGGAESDRGIALVDIKVSLNNVTFTDLGTMPLRQAPGSSPYTGEDYSLPVAVSDARYVSFTSLHNFGGADSDYTGISEIRFIGSTPTPEPSSIILCGLGAIGLLFAARRRRKA